MTADPSAIAHVIISKYDDLSPLNRQQHISACSGFTHVSGPAGNAEARARELGFMRALREAELTLPAEAAGPPCKA